LAWKSANALVGALSTSFEGEIAMIMTDEMLASRATSPLNVQEGAAAKEKPSQPIVVGLD
jgi:hypothetical protein